MFLHGVFLHDSVQELHFKIGNQGMSLQVGAYYNAKKPAGVADWFLQTQFTLIS